jgi:hypothetical protein
MPGHITISPKVEPMRTFTLITIAVAAGTVQAESQPDWRPDQPSVAAPTVQPAVPVPDVIGPFRAAYQAAGKPRILLFWNATFDDATAATRETVEVTNRTGERAPYGGYWHDGGATEHMERTTSDRVLDSEKKLSILGAGSAVELEVAFRQQLQDAGVRLMDRAASIRFTQAQRDRSGIDPKLIEADAVLGKSDLLLEVVMVFDQRAPLGAGFKVTATDVKTGTSLVTFYTPAMPQLVQPPPYYQATSSGFERRQPHIAPSVPDVGAALARDLMQSLGPRLAAR